MALSPIHRRHAALLQPFSFPLPAVRHIRQGIALALAGDGVLLAAWGMESLYPHWQWVCAMVVLAVAGGALWRMAWWPPDTGLQWTGAQWCLRGAGLAHEEVLEGMRVAVDGQSWLLLKATVAVQTSASGAKTRWLVLLRCSSPDRWPDMRRVLYSSIAEWRPI